MLLRGFECLRQNGDARLAVARRSSDAAWSFAWDLKLARGRRVLPTLSGGIRRQQDTDLRPAVERGAYPGPGSSRGIARSRRRFRGPASEASGRNAHWGLIAFLAHGGKVAGRAAVTHSPEPFSNTVLIALTTLVVAVSAVLRAVRKLLTDAERVLA